MYYRDHSGGYEESMTTTISVNTVEELKEHLADHYRIFLNGRAIEGLEFESCGIDVRNHWDTYYVKMKIAGVKRLVIAGMSDGKFQ